MTSAVILNKGQALVWTRALSGVDDPDINVKRVKARVASGGYFIDEATIRNRYDISLQNLTKIVPLCDEVFIYDNSGEVPNLIFHLSENELMQWVDELPKWCAELLEELLTLGYTK
ncbi:hypothetical protein ACWIUH_02850 [Ursidibacter arcticus]